MPYGFRDKKVAETLKRVALERLGAPQRKDFTGLAFDVQVNEQAGLGLPSRKLPSLRGYIVVPKETIPGAEIVGGKLILGKGTACLYRRNQDSATGKELMQHKDEENSPVEVTIYNFCPEAIDPEGESCQIGGGRDTLFVAQDMFGDLYIVEKCCSPPCSPGSPGSESAPPGSESGSPGSESESESGSPGPPISNFRYPIQFPYYATWLHSGAGSGSEFKSGDNLGWRFTNVGAIGDQAKDNVTNLLGSCTSYGDPCLRLDKAGIWRIDWTIDYEPGASDWGDEFGDWDTEETVVGDHGYHSHDILDVKFDATRDAICARSWGQYNAGSGWGDFIDTIGHVHRNRTNQTQVTRSALLDVPANTTLRFFTELWEGYGSGSVTWGSIILEWVNDRP